MDRAVEYLNNKNGEWVLIEKDKQDIPEEAYGRILQCTGEYEDRMLPVYDILKLPLTFA